MSWMPTSMGSSRAQPWNQVRINPGDIVGNIVKRVHKSSTHPALTIDFDDGTAVQNRVDGYDPRHPGLPKSLETDSHLEELINQEGMLDLTILGCAYVTLSDKAFTVRTRGGTDNCNDPQHRDQQHVGLAFKLPNVHNGKAHWHCVWDAKQDHDGASGACLFRGYEDVYLDHLPPARRSRPGTLISARKHRRRHSKVSNS